METLSSWIKEKLEPYKLTIEYEEIVGLIESIENSHRLVFVEREDSLSDRMADRQGYILGLCLDIHDFQFRVE